MHPATKVLDPYCLALVWAEQLEDGDEATEVTEAMEVMEAMVDGEADIGNTTTRNLHRQMSDSHQKVLFIKYGCT
jgi:hypothetical protein